MPFSWLAGLRREVLPNGLTLLVQRDRSAPAVAVVTWVRAGFLDEPDEWVGISHVLEHMFFKGTPRLAPGAVARETRAAGGYLNAHTSYDHTAYFVVLPPEGLARALDIQAEALQHAAIDAGELARERVVILEEARRKLDTADSVAAETLHEVLFDRHRIRRWRIGTEAGLSRLTRDDLMAYYASRYAPARTIVSIVGDVDDEEALALARQRYGGWTAPPSEVPTSPGEPERREVRARTLRGDVTQSELVLGWRGVPALDADEVPLSLGAAVLTAGRGSWLYQSLREPGLVSSVAAHHYATADVGVMAVAASLAPERMPEVIAGLATAAARLATQGPDADDVDRARALLRQRWARRMETVDGRAMALASAEALGDPALLDREFEALERATAADVRRAAARCLDPEAVAGVIYHPSAAGAALEADALGAAFAVVPLPTRRAQPAPSALRAAPSVAATNGATPAGLLHVALAGRDLLVQHKGGVPQVSLGVYAARQAFDAPDDAGLGALAMRTAVRGAGGLDAHALAVAFERLGGVVSPSLGADWSGFGVSVQADALPEAARLLASLVEAPRFSEADVAAERAIVNDDRLHLRDDMFRQPFQLAYGAAFDDRAYGLPPLGTADTLARFDAAAVRRWHEAQFGAARLVVLAVGAVHPDRTARALEAAFGAGAAVPRTLVPALETPDFGAAPRVDRRDKSQTALAMVFPGPHRRHPARHAAETWAAIAGGLGGRLFERLRSERSLAYTVVASAAPRVRAGTIATYIATSPAREAEAADTMLAELREFAEDGVTAEELARATGYLAGQARVRRQSGASMAAEILDAFLLGDGLGELDDPAARYRGVTAEQVHEVARQAFGDGRHVLGVVRGRGGAG